MAYQVELLDCVVSRRSTRSREGNPAAARALQEISNKKKVQLEKRERAERAAAATAGTSKVWQRAKKRRCRTKASREEAKTASGARESSNEIRVGGYFNPLLPSYADAVRMPSSPSRPAASAAAASTSPSRPLPAASAAVASTSPSRPRTASSSFSNVNSKKKKRSRSHARAPSPSPSPSSSPVKKSLKTKNRCDSSIARKIVRRSSNGSCRPHHCRTFAPKVPAPGTTSKTSTTAGVEPALARASALGRPAAPAAPADASKSADWQSTGDETTYDAAGFVDFTDDPSKFPPSLTAAVDALKALHMTMIERAAAGDEHLAPCVSTTYAAPFWSSARMGTCAGHFPPEDAIGDRSCVTLRTAQSGKWAGSLQAANPCQRIFNHLLHRTDATQFTATEARYVDIDGTESTMQLSPEAVWLLSNDFCDLFPALTASHLGSRVVRATVKSLGTEFMVELIYAFASVLKERAEYTAKIRGVASGAATIMVWGAGTADGKSYSGVLRDVSTCLTNMGIAHAKMRHPEAILRGNSIAKLGAQFDDKELSAFMSACTLQDVSGNATSSFLGVENITDADRSLLREVMRQIGKSVMKKPGKEGSEKRQVYDALVASCQVHETESEQEKRGKHLRCCKIAQVCVSLFGMLISAGIVAKGDAVLTKLQKLATTQIATVLKRLKIDGKNLNAYDSVLTLTKKNVKAESSKAQPLSSWMDALDAIAAKNLGEGATHADATFGGVAEAAGMSLDEAKKLSYSRLLDAIAAKNLGEGATHADATFERVAEAAGMSLDEAKKLSHSRVLDAIAAKNLGEGATHADATFEGVAEAAGMSLDEAKKLGFKKTQCRVLQRLLGIAEDEAEKLTYGELLDAHASKMRGDGATHASISFDGVAEAAGMSLDEAKKLSHSRVLDAIAAKNLGEGATHADATFEGVAEAAGMSLDEAKKLGFKKTQCRVLQRLLGIAEDEAEKLTYGELLDAHASKMRGDGATHASISFDGVAEAAGIDVSEARNMEYVRLLDLATQQRHGSGVTHSVAKRAGMLAAVGVSDKDTKVIGSVSATQRTAHRLALARSLGVDLAANSSQKTTMGIKAEEFDALDADEKMAVTMTIESLDYAELFDLDPDEAFELRQSMSLANMDPSSTLNQIVLAFEASLSKTKERNRPVAELLAANEGGEKLTAEFLSQLSVHRYHEAHLARKSAFTLAEIREMSLGAFKRHYAELQWPCYDVDVQRYRDEGRWVDHTDARFAGLRILIEQSRNGLQRGLPADWAENFAMVSTQKAHQVELRLYVRKAETWQMAKCNSNIVSKTKKGPWGKCLRFTAVSGDRQKIEVVEAHFPHLRPFDPTLHLAVDAHAATSAWSTRHLPQRCVEEWKREGTWIDVAEVGHDFLDYLLNDPRADELPDDWEERVRFHRYGNNSATDPTTSVYLDVYVDRRPAGETTSVWFGVRRAQDAHNTQQVPRYQLAFLKAHFFQSAFEARPLSRQMKICELGHWCEEYMFDKEVSPLDVLFYQHENRWLTHDISRTRTASRGDSFDGFEKISLHLARFDPSIRKADWRDSFAFVRVPRADRPNTWRYFMCVFHRGKWRECGVRTSAKKHCDDSLMPNQNYKMSWFQRGEFVRLWFDSARV